MPDWTKTMDQTFEYYIVDPETWRDKGKLDNVKSCSITRDSTVETLGSATIDLLNIDGECYVREYLVTIQNGITERFPLGTHLLQTPSSKFDGKVTSVSVDAYTPLIELKESPPPLGYSILKGENIMQNAKLILREKMRAPIVGTECETDLFDDFVQVLSQVDALIMLDVYAAGETPIVGADSKALCRSIRNLGKVDPILVSDTEQLGDVLDQIIQDGDLILAQGAGSVSKISRGLAERWKA